MALARRGAGGAKKKSKRYRKKATWKNMAKKAAIGTAAGMAISATLTYAAKHFNKPELMEAGQRGGAIVAGALGGTPGQVGYQVADAVFDRVLFGQNQISGTSGMVYL